MGDRDRKPQDRDRKPSDRDRKPYDRDRKPSDRDRKPYDRDRKPSDRDRKPYDRDRKPYDRDRDRRPTGDRKPYGDRKPAGDRPTTDRSRKPYGDRKPYGGAAPMRDERPRDSGPRHDDPEVSEAIQAKDLDRSARAELKTLSKDNADWVARHLVAAALVLDDDPALAHKHALAAARRAGRIAVVRETLAITAYATGDFSLALRELRTYRRLSGSNDQLPLMVDSERGIGRPDRALELGRSVDRSALPAAVQAGLAIAMSGARLDLGQTEQALAELEVPQLDPDRAFSYSPALFAAYAEVLDELGRGGDAETWRERAERAEAALEVTTADAETIDVVEIELEAEAEAAQQAAAEQADLVAVAEPGTADDDATSDASSPTGEADSSGSARAE